MNQPDLWPAEWSERELAYIAGFFDGEGCVGLYGGRFKTNISNTDVRPLHRVKELFGGSLRRMNPTEACPSVMWRWEVGGIGSERFLAALLPYLIVKKDQADLFLSMRLLVVTNRRPNPSRQKIADAEIALKAMKKCGRPDSQKWDTGRTERLLRS